MSADLDAIAQKIVNRFESHFREWMMPGEHAEAVEITKEVLSEAIAQDRKAREGRIKYLESSKEAMRQQLAQQSAALVVAEKALRKARGYVYDSDIYEGDRVENEDTAAIDAALAQLAEAPRDHIGDADKMGALTSGEAVEAFITEAITRGFKPNTKT